MRSAHRALVRAALTALIATGIVVVATPQQAMGLPTVCSSGAGNVHTWLGGAGVLLNWDTPGNWSHNVVPNGPNEIVCIGADREVFQDSTGLTTVQVAQLHIDGGGVLDVRSGTRLFVNGTVASEWAAGSQVFLDAAWFGGTAPINVHGLVELTGNVALTSINAGGGAAWGGQAGALNIASDGTFRLAADGSGFWTRYQLNVAGRAELQSGTFISADHGTATTIAAGGTFDINGDGGYYQGAAVSGFGVGTLSNNGLLSKSGGGSTSVVDAAYSQGPSGKVSVDCCATLAFAGPQQVGGDVAPSMSLGTAACGVLTVSICNGSVNPAVDPSSVTLRIPGSNPQVASVQLQELAALPATVDSRAIGNEVYAHADQLAADPANPATITLRFSQADVMATPLAEVQVGHISDAGVMTKTPDCISGTIPPGAPYCIQRPVTRTSQNTFVTVLTTQTSRWRVRRQLPGESFDQTAPGAARNLVATLAPPGDGSKVALSWAAPATDGGAAVSAYRVLLDGKLLFANNVGSTSAVVSDPGPGKHSLSVVAVNSIGASAGADVNITIDKLSKPRNVKAVQGKKGGKLTAGAKWKAPADAGGFAITKYKVAVFKKNGKKVDTKVVKADRLKYLFKLKSGKYFFKVKARNTDRWGPWSKPTDLVRPR